MEQKSHTSRYEETSKGNVRIRLDRFGTAVNPTYGVELCAYNARVGRIKPLFFQGGMDRKDARVMFERFAKNIRGFDWHADDFLLE